MTIVPNLLITGILCIVVSLAVVAWAAALVQRSRGGLVLILLSVAMLLVGGGFAPPLMGLLAGVAGIESTHHRPGGALIFQLSFSESSPTMAMGLRICVGRRTVVGSWLTRPRLLLRGEQSRFLRHEFLLHRLGPSLDYLDGDCL